MRFRRVTSLFLCLGFVLNLASCKNNTTDINNTSSGKKWREAVTVTEEKTEKFVDTDGDFEYKTVSWDGPEDYVIIYPKGDDDAKESANLFRDYYKSAYSIELPVKTDATTEAEKEVLIGKTNRKQSKNNFADSDLEVSIKDSKLVFSGGHYVTVKSAVEKFLRLEPEKGEAFTFKLTTDFTSTILDGYEYVWGDEFEGSGLDFTKWDFEEKMGGGTKIQVSMDRDVADAADGRLKLHALNYFDPLREGAKYKVPCSLLTKYKMNYVYGYVEIRARVPFEKGAWPSFWSQIVGGMQGGQSEGGVAYNKEKAENAMYGVEVDIFEVFGHQSQVVPNAHKAYNESIYNYKEKHNTDRNKTVVKPVKIWDWADKGVDLSTLSQQYHIYGFEWTPKEMSFYVDGEKYFTMDIVNSWDLCSDMGRFHEPLFLIFNNHLFADDMEYIETLVEDHSRMPYCYYIDYCRLYQKPGVGELYIDRTPNIYSGRK